MTRIDSVAPFPLPQLLTPIQAAQRLSCSTRFLASMRRRGNGPRFTYVGGLVRYSIAELGWWIYRCPTGHPTARAAV